MVFRRANFAACAKVGNEDCPLPVCADKFRVVSPSAIYRKDKRLILLCVFRDEPPLAEAAQPFDIVRSRTVE